MILENTKEFISNNINIPHKFIFHGSRNQNEEFFGTIKKVFPAIFIVELSNGQVRSYSYNDVLIANLEIVD